MAEPPTDWLPIPGTGYALRGVVVAPHLDLLTGPTVGLHRLPGHLESSLRRSWDFDDDAQRRMAYEIVLGEACSQADLTDWLDRDTLLLVWPRLYLPKVVREAWEAAHPILAATRTGHGQAS